MHKGVSRTARAAENSDGGGGCGKSKSKSKALTYLLWLVGGVCGLHHFYLGRDLQGVLWWCTFGGYFGFGWLRDVFYIGEYVADANRDENYMKKVDYMVRVHEKVSLASVPNYNCGDDMCTDDPVYTDSHAVQISVLSLSYMYYTVPYST